ncbi:MAG: 30S ribosomal protein S20 [Spirochaetales bacterium]|nr:30S ribosomal protein S20 [Spirochaetales bacterium]
MKRSAKKRNTQSKQRRLRNRSAKSEVRTAVKKFDAACAAGDKAAAEVELHKSLKLLDTIAGKGIMHRNATGRKKSRMQLKFNKLA